MPLADLRGPAVARARLHRCFVELPVHRASELTVAKRTIGFPPGQAVLLRDFLSAHAAVGDVLYQCSMPLEPLPVHWRYQPPPF